MRSLMFGICIFGGIVTGLEGDATRLLTAFWAMAHCGGGFLSGGMNQDEF